MNSKAYRNTKLNPQGEIDSFNAILSNITPSDIPLAENIDIEELKNMDNDPLEVVVEIPAGKSKRNWNYTPNSLKDIVDYTKKNTLNGFLGHQKAENVSTEFLPPATHWIGAEMIGDKAYFRGLVDADATSLKRWLRTKRIREVSIFGYPDLKVNQSTGEMDVVGYDPLSIDWTPLHRPGMPTKIIGMEMSGAEGEQLDGTFERLKQDLHTAISNELGGWCYIESIRYDDNTVVVENETEEGEYKLYNYSFTVDDNNVALGDKEEVIRKTVYESAGEMKGEEDMKLEDVLKGIKDLTASGEMDAKVIAGEVEELKEAMESKNVLEQVKELLNVSGEMSVMDAIKAQTEELNTLKSKADEVNVDKMISDKVSGELAQNLVKKMIKLEQNATEEEVAGEISRVLEDDIFKQVVSRAHIDQSAVIGAGASNGSQDSGLIMKKVRI